MAIAQRHAPIRALIARGGQPSHDATAVPTDGA
jgi:hypothetical protein